MNHAEWKKKILSFEKRFRKVERVTYLGLVELRKLEKIMEELEKWIREEMK